jgi:hypothetical protein
MQASKGVDKFAVDLNGVTLSEEEKVKLAGSLQAATLAALASFDLRGDHVAIAFPNLGRTRGIWIYDRELLEGRLPELRQQLEEFGGAR